MTVPTEIYPSDGDLTALSETTNAVNNFKYGTIREAPSYLSEYKREHLLLLMSGRANDLRVCKDGDLTYGVYAGVFLTGDTTVSYAASALNALTNNATNYIYLTAAGTLTINTTGFPVPSVTPHVRLATIATGSASVATVTGKYDQVDITDYRGTAIISVSPLEETITVYNDTGSEIAAGKLLYISGYNTTNSCYEIGLADADDPGKPAQLIASETISITSTGEAVKKHNMTAQDTSGTTVGDPIYLSATAGEWTDTAPTGDSQTQQEVGVIKTVNASTGIVSLYCGFVGSQERIDIDALPSEISTFFGATDITGAQAETLSDGSNADLLHIHSLITIANEASDTTCYPAFYTDTTGSKQPKTNAGLTFNSSTSALSATGFSGPLTGNVTGDVTGNAGTATALDTARTIGGASFDGTANIVPSTITIADEPTDTTCFIGFYTAATGALQPKTVAGLTLDAATAILTAGGFVTAGNGAFAKALTPEIKTDTTAPTDLAVATGAAKTIVLATPVYKDINTAGYLLVKPASSAPGVDTFLDEAGADTTIETYAFDVDEKVHGGFELQHDYKEGTDLVFHVHWQGIAAPSGTDNVQWRLNYIVMRDDTTLNAAVAIDSPDTPFDTQYETVRTDFAAITGTNFLIGDQFMFTLTRVTATGDAYSGDALIATAGIHYQVDTVGSRSVGTK